MSNSFIVQKALCATVPLQSWCKTLPDLSATATGVLHQADKRLAAEDFC
ncbi:hypothetical protein [Lichenicoccus roseus]|nr:hypothetical protein [Lichenicoccus roseus]